MATLDDVLYLLRKKTEEGTVHWNLNAWIDKDGLRMYPIAFITKVSRCRYEIHGNGLTLQAPGDLGERRLGASDNVQTLFDFISQQLGYPKQLPSIDDVPLPLP